MDKPRFRSSCIIFPQMAHLQTADMTPQDPSFTSTPSLEDEECTTTPAPADPLDAASPGSLDVRSWRKLGLMLVGWSSKQHQGL